MKEGDLVKRKNIWSDWEAHNQWFTDSELEEIGMIVKWEGVTEQIVLWPSLGLSWEDEDDLEVVNERR